MLLMESGLILLAICLSVYLLWVRPLTAALATAALAAFWNLFQSGGATAPDPALQLGVSLYPPDIACIVLCVSSAVTFLRARAMPRDTCWPAVLLLGLCFLDFARGSLVFGVKPAGNFSRNTITLVLPMVAVSSLSTVISLNANRIVNFLAITALSFGAVAAARWSGLLGVPPELAESSGGFRAVVRVLPAEYAFVIGQALIGILGLQLSRGFRASGLVLAGLFASLVFALQHRSVWMATTAGLVWLAFRSPRAVRREWLKFSCVVLLLASALVLAPLIASNRFDRGVAIFRTNLAEAEQDNSSWAWRVEGYSEATQRLFSGSIIDTAIGGPIGDNLSDKADSYAAVAIHDRYIFVLVYYGVAGLALLLMWLALSAGRLHLMGSHNDYNDRSLRSSTAILESLLVSVVIFFVPYNGELMQGLLLGAMWLASAPQSSQRRHCDFAAASLPPQSFRSAS